MRIDKWFPTVIGVADCDFINDVKDEYNKILSTIKDKEHGFFYYQLQSDKRFKRLTDWVTDNVNEYAKLHYFEDEYEIGESWINDYDVGGGQPYHAHNGWTISCNFIFESNENDVPTVFKSPYYVDPKNPTKTSPLKDPEIRLNEYTYRSAIYPPVVGRLLIFRSNIEHCTGPGYKTMKSKRTIFAFNLDPKKR